MKLRYSTTGYNKNNLPTTRRQQLKDFITKDFRLIARFALILFLALVPEILLFMFKNSSISSIVLAYNNGEITSAESKGLLSGVFLIYDAIQFVTIFIIFFVVCGLLRAFRVMFWNEGLFLKSDFFTGIKKNIKRTIIYSLVVAMLLFVKDQIYYWLCNINFGGSGIINGLISVIIILFVLPILFLMMELDNYYNYSRGDCFIVAFKLFMRKFLIYVAFFAPLLLAYLINFINPIIWVIVVAILALITPAILLLTNHAFTLDLFDKLINTTLTEVLNKGLYKEEK